MSTPPALEQFLAAGPWPQRAGLRVLLELAQRPRGARLLRRSPQASALATSMLGLGRYEDGEVARSLGYDADAVVGRARG